MIKMMTVPIPEFAAEYGLRPEEIERRLKEWLVLSLYTEERISTGKAAKLMGISRLAFIDLLSRWGIAYLDMDSDDLASDLKALQ